MNPTDTNNKPLALPAGQAAGVNDSQLLRSGLMMPAVLGQSQDPAAHLPPGVAAAPTMTGLGHALRRRWLLALSAGLGAATLAVVAIFFLMPAKYTALARLQIASRSDNPIFGPGTTEDSEFALYKLNVAAMVKNPLVLVNALNRKTKTGQDVKDLSLVRARGGSIDWIEGAIKTNFKDSPETLSVTLSGDLPDETAELLNAIVDALKDEYDQKEKTKRKQRIDQLKENQKELEKELDKYRIELRSLEQKENLPDKEIVRDKFLKALDRQSKAQEALTKNRIDQITTKQQIEFLREQLKQPELLPISVEKLEEAFRLDPRAQGPIVELQKVEKEISDTKATLREEFWPAYLEPLNRKRADLLKRVAALKQEMRPELEQILRLNAAGEYRNRITKLTEEMELLARQEPVLLQTLNNLDEEVRRLAPVNQQVQPAVVRLREKITNTETSLAKVAQTIQLLTAEPLPQRVWITQYASEPRNKDYSRQTKFGAIGALGLFCLGLFGVAFLEFRSRKINDADDVAHGLGLNVVGALPAMPASIRKPAAAATTPQAQAWQSQLHEAVDSVRTMLLHASRAENLRVIMVTSAVAGEGKTSLASQLASSLARAWRKTLLIDGDLRHPASHQLFDLPLEPGLSEVLRNEVSVNYAIKPTNLSRLWLMPAGHLDAHAVQALAQDNVRTLFEQLKQQYDFIVVDCSPVLPVADALLMGQHVDGVLFSVLRDVSRAPSVYAAQQKLNNLGVRILGAVMIGAHNDVGHLGREYAKLG